MYSEWHWRLQVNSQRPTGYENNIAYTGKVFKFKGVNLRKIKVAGVRNGHQNIRLPRLAVSIKCYLLLK